MIKHCLCCNCLRLAEYEALKSPEEQIAFLNNLTTLDRLRLIVADTTYSHVDELLDYTKVLDMKKLLYHIKARFQMQDCDEMHTFSDIADKHIEEICALIAKYIIFQIDILDDYFDQLYCYSDKSPDQNELNFEILKYMFADECEFILNTILQTQEQKENYVNTLMRRHYIYYDFFRPYVIDETIFHFMNFHKENKRKDEE
jgi:hypothetical protein